MPLYKKMSKEPGFPSFFDDKKELYGDDYHIVEEIKPFQKRTNQEKLIINHKEYLNRPLMEKLFDKISELLAEKGR